MIEVKLGKSTLVVESKYDSGTHIGIKAYIVEEGQWSGKSLNEICTKEQINAIEVVVSSMIKSFIEVQ